MPVRSLDVGERTLVEAVSADRLMAATRAISQWVRLSGTPDEAQAFDWIEERLRAYGLETSRYLHPGLVSWPESATLTASAGAVRVPCATHAFAVSTPRGGLAGPLVYVGRGTDEELRRVDLRGKIALVDGIIAPNKNLAVEATGAAGSVWIAGTYLHERALSPVWGTPTPETARLLPTTPSVSVTGHEGARLRDLAQAGPVEVHLDTRVYRGWKQLPCLVGDLRAAQAGSDAETFVMFSGHVDSWYYGAMDNGTANATMLEVARVLGARRADLRRGFRVAFWSGHSHARYAGSAWYADHFWHDLHDRCVAHVNVDSVGGRGATVLSEGNSMGELREFASDVIEQLAGQRLSPRRYGRAGDQSFWGHGIPSLLMLLSEQPAEHADPVLLALHHQISGGVGKSGGPGWWWHTPDDTVDKIDPAFLKRDAEIYAVLLYRLCTAALLPIDHGPVLADLHDTVRDLQAACGDRVDLSPVARELAALRSTVEELRARAAAAATDAEASAINRARMGISRMLIPVDYTRTGQFDHDLAVPTSPLPGLQGAHRLASLSPGTDEYEFLLTRLVRERNRTAFAVREARRAADEALAQLGGR
ncbi:MAG TPA: M28 family peptidase [bacterium]|nr:M28 family peptidase [bacterium]